MVHTIKLGGLYLDGKPTALETEYPPGQNISFGDTAPDMAISWVPVNGLLIADRCLLTNTSWDDLDAQGLVYGKEIKVQGFKFTVRLLQVGNNENVPNEWDASLDTVGEDDGLWHWKEKFFWGQESVDADKDGAYHAYRGYFSARYWFNISSGYRTGRVGFRPALEPLPTDASDLRRGQSVMVIGRDGCVVGELVDETQYDFVIQPEANGIVGAASFVATMRDGILAVDRTGILGVAVA